MTHPGAIAIFDQARAEFGAAIDLLVELYTKQAAQVGEGQAVANLSLYLRDYSGYNEGTVRALLATAIQIFAESRAAAGGVS